jgi:hypothetical protein
MVSVFKKKAPGKIRLAADLRRSQNKTYPVPASLTVRPPVNGVRVKKNDPDSCNIPSLCNNSGS